MKISTSSLSRNRLLQIVVATAIAFFLSSLILVSAQTQQVRKYGTRQMTKIGGIVVSNTSTLPLAVDADPFTSSNITIGAGVLNAYIEQIIDFNPSSSANTTYATMLQGSTPITVKFTLPAGLIAALGGLEIQAIKDLSKNGLGTVSYDNVGAAYTGTSLVSLVNGTGEVDVTIVPGADYQGIRVRIKSGVLSAAYGVDIFGAYIKENASSDVACSNRIDRLNGVTSNDVANLASGLGSVQDPENALDASDATFAQLNMGAQVLNATYLTAIFNSKSKVNDSIRIVLQNSTPSLLTLGLLNSFSIRLYDGSNLVKTITNTSSILNLSLLSGGTQTYALTAEVDVEFDRIQILYGGVASALNSLRIYDINRKVGSPLRTNAQRNVYVYAGQSAVLSATPAIGDAVTWYDEASAGNIITNPIATTLAQANTIQDYFAQISRTGCNDVVGRAKVDLHIVGVTSTTPILGSFGLVYNGSVAVTASSTLPVTPSYTYTLIGNLPAGLTLNNTTGAITGTPTQVGTFTFSVQVQDVANNLPVGQIGHTMMVDGVLPDLTPIIIMNNTGFIKPTDLSRNATIRIYNIAPASLSYGPVTVYFYPASPHINVALTPASAANWTISYTPDNGGYYTLVSNSAILYGSTNYVPIGLNFTATNASVNGVYNMLVQIATNAGSEANNLNNTKSVNISISE